jgi:enoyl-CoA hydratase/carnithine racemase
MRILLISSAYNSMTQRAHVELADRGHEVSVELALGDDVMRDAVRRCDPHLVIAPMLTTATCLPVSPASALRCGLVDQVIGGGAAAYRAQVAARAEQLASSPDYPSRLAAKAQQLAVAAAVQPLDVYRQTELAEMYRNFYDPREPYAELRHAFVHKQRPTRTPPHLSRHHAQTGPFRSGRSREQGTLVAAAR